MRGRPFPPGTSGNASGKPKAHPEVRAMIAAQLPLAVDKLAEMLQGNDRDDVRFAIKSLLEWGLAKPTPEPPKKTGERLALFCALLAGEDVAPTEV